MKLIDLNNLGENLKEYDLFLVDFDGTIIDSMVMWRHICPSFLEYKNIETNDDVLALVKSLTNLEIAKMMRDRYFPNSSYEEVVSDFFEFIRKEYVKQNVKPRAYEFLTEINKIGKVVLYTATAMTLISDLLDLLDLKKYYQGIYSGSDMKWAKRDGSGYLNLIDLLGYNGKKVLVVEDAPHAVIGANNVGLDVLVVKDYSNISMMDEIDGKYQYFIDLF